jgi:hypothetical protein
MVARVLIGPLAVASRTVTNKKWALLQCREKMKMAWVIKWTRAIASTQALHPPPLFNARCFAKKKVRSLWCLDKGGV